MHECITIAHNLPQFDVTNPSEILPCTNGGLMIRTKGELLWDEERICTGCSSKMHVHDTQSVRLRHLPLLGRPHFLEVSYRRYKCPECGQVEAQEIPFKAEGHMMTRKLEDLISEYLSYGLTLKAVNRLLGVHVHIAKETDRTRLKKRYDGPPKEYSKHIAIDEISIHRRHRYATVVLDLDTGHVIFCEAGKKKQQVEHFIAWAGKDWMKRVRAVAMDMNAQYDSAFREHAPHVKIVYDCFHLIKQYNDNVITAIRRRVQNEAYERGDKEVYDTLKGGRFLLVAKPETLEKRDREARENNRHISENYTRKGLGIPPGMRLMKVDRQYSLRKIMGLNRELNTAYVLLEQFRLAYKAKDVGGLEKGLTAWCGIADRSGIAELIRFKEMVASHMQGIVSHAIYRISTGRLEGTNNLAKVIKRNAYGFHDDEYFFLKLKDASCKPKRKPASHRFLL